MSDESPPSEIVTAMAGALGGTVTSGDGAFRGRTWTWTVDPEALYAGLVKDYGQAKVDELQAAFDDCETLQERYQAYKRVLGDDAAQGWELA